MNPAVFTSFLLICGVLWGACTWTVALSCDSCGRECAASCGTRHFRTCCFNYLKKRSSPPYSPGLKLELWLAKSRGSQFRNFDEMSLGGAIPNAESNPVDTDIPLKDENTDDSLGSRLQVIYDA